MEEKDFDITITKRRLLWEQCNDKCHNFYYLVNGRIYKKTKPNEYRRFRKFKFIMWFDIFDLQEWFEGKEKITKEDQLEYLDQLIFSMTEIINSFEDCQEFYEECIRTIKDYNILVFRR